MNERAAIDPVPVLASYRVGDKPLYIVGTFDTGVTVFSQQVRALNFAWAAIEADLIPSKQADEKALEGRKTKLAIVGGGFAGLTLAAGLMRKGANADITLFEQRDTLLPLQHGSDSRWLHPRIYDWPDDGSEAGVAMLPVLNWTAARASDVVVQILAEWERIVDNSSLKPTLYCNTRHLQIHGKGGSSKRLVIEWVGEQRDPRNGTSKDSYGAAVGEKADFDAVIMAVGFGLERDNALSYWRNDTTGQPSLDQPRRTYLVSGQGDGAMIDLLRLRISQYRQDRILEELFHNSDRLNEAIKNLYKQYAKTNRAGLFDAFEELQNDSGCAEELRQVRHDLTKRLRRDTDVVLQMKLRKLSELFDPENTRISFQNKLLVYLLYKCGGFVPSSLSEEALLQQHSIAPDRVIRRHGTLRDEQLSGILSTALYDAIKKRRGSAIPDPFSQSDKILWSGGYFGFPGPLKAAVELGDVIREHWRKEYLPGPTALLATAFCASVAGMLCRTHSEPGRLRVTLHRAVRFGGEELLQQCCDYFGTDDARGTTSAAARTFPAHNATVGLAYKSHRIVRSRRNASRQALNRAMKLLQLNTASRTMSSKVGFLLAIPILEPREPRMFTSPSPVLGVLYVDSTADGFFIEDEELSKIVHMTNQFLSGLEKAPPNTFERIRNVPLTGLGTEFLPAVPLPNDVARVFELVAGTEPPSTSGPFQLNFDYSDFVPVNSHRP